MFILGATTERRGSELESLTKILLERLGYRDVATNAVGVGGAELDVTANLPVPLPGAGRGSTIRVICECKAQRALVDTTAWLKFIGKTRVEQLRLNQEVRGLFVALTGVNGNVRGSFDEIRGRTDTISLLHGSELEDLVREWSKSISFDDIRQRVMSESDPSVRSGEMFLWDGAVYWLIRLANEQFTLASGSGLLLTQDRALPLLPLIQEHVSGPFLDVVAHRTATERGKRLRQLSAAELIIASTPLSQSALTKRLGGLTRARILDGNAPTEPEVVTALQELESAAIALQTFSTDWALHTTIDHDTPPRPDQAAELLRVVFNGPIPLEILSSATYERLIQLPLLDYACELQGGLALDEPDRQTAMNLLRLSPHAVLLSITPDPFLIRRTTDAPVASAAERLLARDHFMARLLSGFEVDYGMPQLGPHFVERHGLLEVEATRRYAFKNVKDVWFEVGIRTRTAIRPLREGGHVKIAFLPDVPEPWDSDGMKRYRSRPPEPQRNEDGAS